MKRTKKLDNLLANLRALAADRDCERAQAKAMDLLKGYIGDPEVDEAFDVLFWWKR